MTHRTWPVAGCLLLTLLTACGSDDSGTPGAGASTGPLPAVTATPNAAGTFLEATIVGNDDLDFVPANVLSKAGRLALTLDVNGRVPHDLLVDGVEGAKLDRVDGGQSDTLTFDVTPGTYTLICTFHSGMRGTLVVTP